MTIIPEGKQFMTEHTGDKELNYLIKRLKWLDDLLDCPHLTIKESPTINQWHLDALQDVSDYFKSLPR